MNGSSPVSYYRKKDLFLSERKNKEKTSKISNLKLDKLENSFQCVNSFDLMLININMNINKPITPKIAANNKITFSNLTFLNEINIEKTKKDKKSTKSSASLIQQGNSSLKMMSKCKKLF